MTFYIVLKLQCVMITGIYSQKCNILYITMLFYHHLRAQPLNLNICVALEFFIYNYIGAGLAAMEADIFALWQRRANKLAIARWPKCHNDIEKITGIFIILSLHEIYTLHRLMKYYL